MLHDTQQLGAQGESLVSEEYRKRGYKFISKNVKILGYKQLGEIDLIMRKGRELAFVEVKTRTSSEFMDPVETVTWRKQNKLRRAVRAYLTNHPEYEGFNFRIDAAIVEHGKGGLGVGVDSKNIKVYIIEDVIQDTA